jgi:WhiB family redox-sensing transcriptional regulator
MREHPSGPRPEWMERAACRGHTEADFFPDGAVEAAKQPHLIAQGLCYDCPVKLLCREYAVVHWLPGYWGGSTDRQRKKIRAERKRMP